MAYHQANLRVDLQELEQLAIDGALELETSVSTLQSVQDELSVVQTRVQCTREATALYATQIQNVKNALDEQMSQVTSLRQAFAAFSDTVSHLQTMSNIGHEINDPHEQHVAGTCAQASDDTCTLRDETQHDDKLSNNTETDNTTTSSSRTPSFSSSLSSSPQSQQQSPNNNSSQHNLHHVMLREAVAMNRALHHKLQSKVAVMDQAVAQQIHELENTVAVLNRSRLHAAGSMGLRSGTADQEGDTLRATAACTNLLHFFTTLRARGLVSREQHGTLKELLFDAVSSSSLSHITQQ